MFQIVIHKQKTLLLIILVTLNLDLFSQSIPKEDYISSKSVIGTTLGTNEVTSIKGGGYLYFNDSCVILHFDGLGDKTIFFKTYKKYWNQEDRQVAIVCYDSAKTAKYLDKAQLGKVTPDLYITLNYNASLTRQEGHTKSTTIKYIEVECWFYGKGFRIGFGSDGTSQPTNIPRMRKKYSKVIIG